MADDLKSILHDKLREERADLLSKLDGLGEYDLRRPLTPTGTNLLGLVKHLTGLEFVAGTPADPLGADPEFWGAFYARIAAAADPFRP